MRVGQEIDVGKPPLAIDEVGNGAFTGTEHPALASHQRLDNRKRDHVLELLELAKDDGAVCPWAGQRDIKVIALRLGRKPASAGRSGTSVGCDPMAKPRRRAHKATRADLVTFVLPDAIDQETHDGALL